MIFRLILVVMLLCPAAAMAKDNHAYGPNKAFSVVLPSTWTGQEQNGGLLCLAPDQQALLHISLGPGAWALDAGSLEKYTNEFLDKFPGFRLTSSQALEINGNKGRTFVFESKSAQKRTEVLWLNLKAGRILTLFSAQISDWSRMHPVSRRIVGTLQTP